MSLVEALKEVTEAEEKALGIEPVAKEEPVSPPDEHDEPASEPETSRAADGKFKKVEDKPKDEAKKEEPVKPAEVTPDSASFARLRMEKAAAERRAAAAEARLNQAPTQPQPGPAKAEAATVARAEAEPDPNTDPEGHMRWELAQTKGQLKEVLDWKAEQTHKSHQVSLKENAVKAFGNYEDAFKQTVTDYADVMDFGITTLSNSIRTLNPNLKGEALGEAIQRQVLRLAAQAEQQGFDPAEYLYETAKGWGYKPKAAAPADEPAADIKKPTVKDISQHKKRSASSLTAGGKNGAVPLSREAVLSKDFGLQDFAKLTPSQLRELENL